MLKNHQGKTKEISKNKIIDGGDLQQIKMGKKLQQAFQQYKVSKRLL